MNLKKLFPYIYGILVVSVFVTGFVGFYNYLGHEAHFWGVLMSVISFFAFDDADEGRIWAGNPANPVYVPLIVLSRYLAMALIGLSIGAVFFKFIKNIFQTLKIKLFYSQHIVVFSLDKLGYQVAKSLLKDGYKIVVVENNEESPFIEEIEELGGLVFDLNPFEKSTLDKIGITKAKACILAADDDEANIELAGLIAKFTSVNRSNSYGRHESLKIFIHINDQENTTVIKDYFNIDLDDHYDLHPINLEQLAAQKIYDQYPPHQYFSLDESENENSIAIIGCDSTAESFILENIILSHYHTQKPLIIYLVDKEVDLFFHEFMYKFPFVNEFVHLIPIKLLNADFFAHFTHSKSNIEKLAKVKVAYFFGAKDSELINTAASFRQFLYTQNLQISQTPLIISLPEESAIFDFISNSSGQKDTLKHLFKNSLNQHFIKRTSETITGKGLIEEADSNDLLSRVINFFYAINYEFQSRLESNFQCKLSQADVQELNDFMISYCFKNTSINEQNFETDFFDFLVKKTGVSFDLLYQKLAIKKLFNGLDKRKKESNRYAARHIQVKLFNLKSLGCDPITRENIIKFYSKLAKLEHYRWSGEKMVLNYKYGPMPLDAKDKYVVKEVIKIHDQLIPYENLTQEEKDKDLNLFFLVPLLKALQEG